MCQCSPNGWFWRLAILLWIAAADLLAQPSAPVETPLLTNVSQITSLPLAEARRQPYNAKLSGLLTYQPPETSGWFFLENQGHAVQVFLSEDAGRLSPGTWVEVEGVVNTSTFATTITEARVRIVDSRPLPAPARPTPGELYRGDYHARWVEISGAVMDIALDEGRPVLLLSSQGTTYNLFLAEPHEQLPLDWRSAILSMQGVAVSRIDMAGQPAGFYLVSASNAWLRVLQPGHSNLWACRKITAQQLQAQRTFTDERLQLSGVVTYVSPRGWFSMQDETGTLNVRRLVPISPWSKQALVLPRAPAARLEPGDQIDVVGTQWQRFRPAPQLDYAEYRVTGRESLPAPHKASVDQVLSGGLDGRRVTLEATLLDQETSLANNIQQQTLWLRSGEQTFNAYLYGTNHATHVRPGDRVAITGVSFMLPSVGAIARSFDVYPIGPGDLVRLGTPPRWFTPAVMQLATGGAVLMAITMLWVWALRRKVAERTASLASVNQELTREVEERKHAQQQLHRALAAERELGELKSSFVSMVSHEFRTPLGITMSAVELLRNYEERLSPDKRGELLQDIHGATLLMAGLMEQVLLLGRVEAGKIGFQPAPIDLETLGGKLVDESLSATAHKCPIHFRTQGDLTKARGDESLLRHILSNLISNAVKYSREKTPVEFTLERLGSDAVFTVRDQGIGIPEEDQPKLYEAFHRGRNVDQTPGTGLGLLIVRRCVELHQGKIGFVTAVGQGTTFTVRLPLFDS